MIHKHLKKLLTTHYNLQIESITDAPRQFVAETFFVETDKDTFFCKVVEKPLFINGVVDSLPVLANIHELGYKKINYPIPTTTGELFIMDNDTLVVLFNFIDVPQNYDYDNTVLGETIAEIHQLTPQVSVPINKEHFKFKHAHSFISNLDHICDSSGSDKINSKLQQLMQTNHDFIIDTYKQFQAIATKCVESQLTHVITHGDAPGNVLVKSPDDIYIVDWDDILLAPAERDLWFLIDKHDFMTGYTNKISGYKPNQLTLDYYLLSRYFNDMVEYWAEIRGNFSDEHRIANFRQLNKELFSEDGWLQPLVKNFAHND